jgi:hypothetical protein
MHLHVMSWAIENYQNVYFQGDLRTHLSKKGALPPSYAVKLALDIARFTTHNLDTMR